MKGDGRIRCYRCGDQTQLVTLDGDTQEIGTILVHLACPRCGQLYELQYALSAIFATDAGGEAQALLRHCEHCDQLYRSPEDEPHVCRDEGISPTSAGDAVGGEST
jgi:uncharacterized C2H2 Zn-finger protein